MLRLCLQASVETPVLKFASLDHKKLVLERAWPQLFLLYASACRTGTVSKFVEEFLAASMVNLQNRGGCDEGSSTGRSMNTKLAVGQLLKFGQALYMDSQEFHLAMCMLICFAGRALLIRYRSGVAIASFQAAMISQRRHRHLWFLLDKAMDCKSCIVSCCSTMLQPFTPETRSERPS